MKPAARRALSARTADKYDLYQRAVQVPEADVRFFNRAFRNLRGRAPLTLREDFGGTGHLSSQWVRSRPDREAWAIDLDPRPLAWGEEHVRAPLGKAAERLHLLRGDVRTRVTPRCDLVAAMNFSYFCFKDRQTLVDYFRHARRHLAPGGMLFLDAFGGPEGLDELVETRRLRGFTYVWQQARFDPIRSELLAHIHFRFPDGSEMKRAFTYDWRVWSVREIRECLAEAGFRHSTVYWEVMDRSGNGTGVYRATETASACQSFVCCLAGHD